MSAEGESKAASNKEIEDLKEYLRAEFRRAPLHRKIFAGTRFHLRQRVWLVALVPIVVAGNLFFPIDVGPVLDNTIDGLIATLALILTSVTLLSARNRILPSEIENLHDTAVEISAQAERVRSKLLRKHAGNEPAPAALRRRFPPSPDVHTEYDLPRLLKHAYESHSSVSNMLLLGVPQADNGEESAELRNLWEKGLNFISRISASAGFLSVVAAPIDFVTISAPIAIVSGIAILGLGSGLAGSQLGYGIVIALKIVYWTSMLATIMEVASIVRRAIRSVMTTAGPVPAAP